MATFLFVAIFAISLFSETVQVDLTRETGSYGPTVVQAVLDVIRSRCIMNSKESVFLRRMAYAESKDGADRTRNGGGIWQIGANKLTVTKNSRSLKSNRTIIEKTLNINWEKVTMRDLEKPLFSGLAAGLYLKYTSAVIQDNIRNQADTWVKHFNGRNRQAFITAKTDDIPVTCDMRMIDLVFVVDASGSIGSRNFLTIKQFLNKIVDKINISNSAFHVGAVMFTLNAKPPTLVLDKGQTKSNIKNLISKMKYYRGGTNIGAGIKAAEDIFKNSNRKKEATKVMLLLTDGRSRDMAKTGKAAENAKKSGINIFTIGIGRSVNDKEMKAVASDPYCTHMFKLRKFNEINSILYEVRKRACQAPKTLSVQGADPTKVEVKLEKNKDVEGTMKVESESPFTSIKTKVSCGVVEVLASADTPNPTPVLYTTAGNASDDHPSSLTINNNRKAVYVHYTGKVVKPRSRTCRNDDNHFDMEFEEINDICSTKPCMNGGKCHKGSTENSFFCLCKPGFTGNDCAHNIDECYNSPCQNGGTCKDLVNSYQCSCLAGFTGTDCETNINECLNSPCQNGGTCLDKNNGFTCMCMPGFTDYDCAVNINECEGSPCINGGQCTDLINGYKCSCVNGYTGSTCQHTVRPCDSSPCQNGGSCIENANEYVCVCESRYFGKNCENSSSTSIFCREGGTERECTLDDLQKSQFSSFICNGQKGVEGVSQQHQTVTTMPAFSSTKHSPIVPLVSTTISTNVGPPCEVKGHVYYMAFPSDPTKYIQCDEHGQKFIRECPPTETWNDNINIKTCTANSKCPNNTFSGKLSHPTDKTKFIQCSHGTAYVMSCPAGTEYDDRSKTCTSPAMRRQLNIKSVDDMNDEKGDENEEESEETVTESREEKELRNIGEEENDLGNSEESTDSITNDSENDDSENNEQKDTDDEEGNDLENNEESTDSAQSDTENDDNENHEQKDIDDEEGNDSENNEESTDSALDDTENDDESKNKEQEDRDLFTRELIKLLSREKYQINHKDSSQNQNEETTE